MVEIMAENLVGNHMSMFRTSVFEVQENSVYNVHCIRDLLACFLYVLEIRMLLEHVVEQCLYEHVLDVFLMKQKNSL